MLFIILPWETDVARIEIRELDVGLGFELLNEVTMPVQARFKCTKGIPGMLGLLKCLPYLSHQQAAVCQIRTETTGV